ncbi:MAG: FxsA family protein [Pseudolabrys sp.]
MTILRGLILAVLALPLLEIAAFALVAAAIGLGFAFALIVGFSVAGALIIRHAGTAHIARVRVAVGENRLSALQAEGTGALTVIAGILLLVPGFITGVIGLLLLLVSLWRMLISSAGRPPAANDNIVDLAPEDWRQVPDPRVSDQRRHDDNH